MKKFEPKPRPYAYRAVTLTIRRDELTTFDRTVPAWEVPLLEAQFAEIVVKDPDAVISFPNPIDAQDEMVRLEQRYRHVTEGGDPGVPLVAQVYGQHNVGLRALAGEIQAAAIGPDEPDPVAAPKPRKARKPDDIGALLGAA